MENVQKSKGTEFETSYATFMEAYNTTPLSGEQIGKQIAMHGQYFASAASELSNAKISYDKVLAIKEQSIDDVTGKALSSAKAERITAATPEGARLVKADWVIKAIDKQITTLWRLQEGAMKEWDNVNKI